MENDKFANVAKHPNKSWPEDYQQENGCYQNRCLDCGEIFMGNKHRSYCKECDIPSPRFWEKLSKKQAPEDNKCAHAGCWADGEMVGFARCMVKEVFPLKAKHDSLIEVLQKIKLHTRDDSTYQLVNSILNHQSNSQTEKDRKTYERTCHKT